MTEIRENKMGVMPIGKLLTSMALPIIISMLVQALYNIVDSIFVSRINEAALTAVSLAFPMQNLMIAVGTGLGVGMNALLSRSLGEKDYKRAVSFHMLHIQRWRAGSDNDGASAPVYGASCLVHDIAACGRSHKYNT